MFLQYRKQLKVLFDNIALLVSVQLPLTVCEWFLRSKMYTVQEQKHFRKNE